jgi:hypothetical protein
MKRTQIMVACALVLALAGATTLYSAEEGLKQAKATVRSVHGTVEYQDKENGPWVPVKPNMKFPAGITVRTGADGTADISVNGTASAVRLTNNTTVVIPTMYYIGSAREGDTTTMLNLKSGGIIGNVKKISANSRYEIITPNGVAGIRGTDFAVTTWKNPDGSDPTTAYSIVGTVLFSAVINGVPQTFTLHTGQSVTVGGTVTPVVQTTGSDTQQSLQFQSQNINNGAPGGAGGPGAGPGKGNPNPPPPSTPPPFIGGPPQGGSAS